MLTIKRTYHKNYTIGKLMLPDDSLFYSLELPWRNNEINVSCIPEGEYIFKRDFTGRQTYFKVLDVENRTHIEMHPARNTSQLMGCIAPCMSVKNGVAVASRSACDKLVEFYGDDTDTKYIMRIYS